MFLIIIVKRINVFELWHCIRVIFMVVKHTAFPSNKANNFSLRQSYLRGEHGSQLHALT